jgi:hypothetical protein
MLAKSRRQKQSEKERHIHLAENGNKALSIAGCGGGSMILNFGERVAWETMQKV